MLSVVEAIPLPSLPLDPEGKLVSCDPSPIKAEAVTLPAIVVVPLNKILKASDLELFAVPFPITKAGAEALKAVALVTVDPDKFHDPITNEP